MVWKCLALVLLCSVAAVKSKTTIRVMTWNMGDNKMMKGKIDTGALRKILGIESYEKSKAAYFDIYAITMQENCFACNPKNFKKISDLVLKELNKKERSKFQYVGHSMTRKSDTCEIAACKTGLHGSTNVFVFAKRSLLTPVSSFHTNKCAGGTLKNAEKGIAAVKVKLTSGGKSLCFAGLHLDSESPGERRKCFDRFYKDHAKQMKDCNMVFFAGDYNTRTGDKGGSKQSRVISGADVKRLLLADEMLGRNPYGGKSLAQHVSKVSGRKFEEGLPVTFYPTYSMKPKKECKNKSPCYRGDRPPSWTDRIICSPCNTVQYQSLNLEYSDHLPVYGTYTL